MNSPFPLLKLASTVVFPETTHLVRLSDPAQCRVAREAWENNSPLAVGLLREDWPTQKAGDIHTVCSLCEVVMVGEEQDGQLNVLLKGLRRVLLIEEQLVDDSILITTAQLEDICPVVGSFEVSCVREELEDLVRDVLPRFARTSAYFDIQSNHSVNLSSQVNHLASILEMPAISRQRLLDESNVVRRARLLLNWTAEESNRNSHIKAPSARFSVN